MSGVRRAHAAALLAGAAALLLLLARLPAPAAPRPPRPAPAPAPAPAAPPPASAPARAPRTTALPPPPVSTVPREPGVVYTRDVYEPGHSVPHPELCPARGARLRLLVLVTSAPSHATARDAVRLTWGHYRQRSDVALAFVLGAPPKHLQPALEAEDALYGDLVIGHSIDSYSNLTLKTISMLEWTATYCPLTPYLLKTDDDVFLNVPRLLRFAAARVNATRTIWGRVIRKSLPKRTTKSKYFVSAREYPGAVFPDFATGPAYLVSGDCVRALLAVALDAGRRYLRLEDVFVTGVAAARAGVTRVHAPEFLNRKVAGHPCALRRAAAVHMVRYHEQFDFWRKLLDNKTKCAT